MSAQASTQIDSRQPDEHGSLNALRAGEGAAPLQTLVRPGQEHRKDSRRRVLKQARIAFKDRMAAIDCTVRNISDGGACLEVESPIGIPASFDLVLDQTCVRSCRVTWRKATRLGVAFV
jgi:PilZ domain